ncbi:MAG TPA: M20/M25/M40 family metallo-hydrolase, partial [Thermodesulfobacteriota bacterium]|nr:M20/M25/M40 family metallo-hydrolase [Thermodesulfobacteriota bacterium]
MDPIQKIYRHLDDHFEENIRDLQAHLRQSSVSLTNEGVLDYARMLADSIRALGGRDVQLVPLTDGFPVVFGKVTSKNPKAKTLILYSLYDLMPYDEEGWKVPPLSAEIVDPEFIDLPAEYGKCIVARGARNQKGPNMAFIHALKAIQAVTGDIPVNVMFAIEGEEEMGSLNLYE